MARKVKPARMKKLKAHPINKSAPDRPHTENPTIKNNHPKPK
jgi:hypothetical protein